MSRIGKRAIAVPSGVTANVEGQTVKIKGPKGALQVALHDDVSVKLESGQIKIEPRAETKRARAQWGTSRTLVNNLISGVTKGFEQRLEISGVGYRAAVQGKNLQIALGYSHDVVYPIPEGIAIATPRPVEDDLDDFARFEQEQDEPIDYRHRMMMNLIALAILVSLVGLGVWIADTISDLQKEQDCLVQGRSNCAPIEVPIPAQE